MIDPPPMWLAMGVWPAGRPDGSHILRLPMIVWRPDPSPGHVAAVEDNDLGLVPVTALVQPGHSRRCRRPDEGLSMGWGRPLAASPGDPQQGQGWYRAAVPGLPSVAGGCRRTSLTLAQQAHIREAASPHGVPSVRCCTNRGRCLGIVAFATSSQRIDPRWSWVTITASTLQQGRQAGSGRLDQGCEDGCCHAFEAWVALGASMGSMRKRVPA